MREIAERVRGAHSSGRPLRIRGAGTWLDAGRPVEAGDALSLAEHRGIIEYVPGDLTLTARAGTPIADIVAATSEHAQWLPLDPWGGDSGTIGATVSTATAGPLAYSMGMPRDVVLGLEFVSGKGDVIRAGGRVVKNVAGFDLARLVVGSWGTLGVVTEVTVRLRARPDHSQTLGIAVDTSPAVLNELALRLRALPFTPLASELVSARLAGHLGGGGDTGSSALLLCRVGGNEKSVKAQLELLRTFGDAVTVSDEMWKALRTIDCDNPTRSAVWRWSQLPARFGSTWNAATESVRDLGGGALHHGNPARGVVRVVARDEPDPGRLARAAGAFDGTIAIERLPKEAWPLVHTMPAGDSVSLAIRAKFDPRGILNAGILGGSGST